MFFDFLSVVILIALSILSVLFILEKKKTKEKFSESHQNLITDVTQINNVISKNQDELNGKLSEHRSEMNAMFQEERNVAQANKDVLEKKIATNFHRFGLTAREKFEGMEKKLATSDDNFRFLASNLKNTYEELEEKVIENNDNLLKFTASTRMDHEELKTNTSENFQVLSDQLIAQATLISKLRADNEELKKQLAFFTEIGSDSKRLNEDIDYKEEDRKLEETVQELKTLFSKKENVTENPPSEKPDATEFNVHSVLHSDPEPIAGHSFLDQEQLNAFTAMETTNNNFFITGKAGTGKSFLLTAFVEATTKKTLKVSPTGIAALNIGGTTIHSAFGFYNLENLDVDQINSGTIRLKPENRLLLREIDTLIIDEISMVRVDKFNKIDRILRAVTNVNVLFGGKQVIVFGDLFQLPPIAKRQEEIFLRHKYGGIFFFHSQAFRDGNFQFIELGTNHRQEKDATFFEVLNRMREGKVEPADISLINRQKDNNSDNLRRLLRLFPKKADADTINQRELDKIPAKEYSYEAKVILNKYNNQNINYESNFPIKPVLKLKLGALVMMVNNHPGKIWVNGTLAIISYISDDIIKVKINDVEYEVQKSVFNAQEASIVDDRIKYEIILQIEQYPIVLGYAITIHKSQGKTYPEIACDVTDCFAPGQAYVALSRCSTLNGLHLLKEIDNRHIAVDSDVRQFYLNARSA